ncbi:hypothetical protein V491_06993 [Pseudogymnoascus sp. VKM F-3775]|nr:hypothetical protein V491_06993 [Pseudogymnoascus sp. VKM F-3775]
MWLSPFSIILPLFITLPVALGAPADMPATTTLLPLTPTLSSTFPLQTPQTSSSTRPGRQDDESNDPTRAAHLLGDPSQTLTEFDPVPTGQDGKVQHCTFSNAYVHCGYHTPVRPGVGPDGSYFDDGGRKEVWIAGVVVGVVVAVVGAVVL